MLGSAQGSSTCLSKRNNIRINGIPPKYTSLGGSGRDFQLWTSTCLSCVGCPAGCSSHPRMNEAFGLFTWDCAELNQQLITFWRWEPFILFNQCPLNPGLTFERHESLSLQEENHYHKWVTWWPDLVDVSSFFYLIFSSLGWWFHNQQPDLVLGLGCESQISLSTFHSKQGKLHMSSELYIHSNYLSHTNLNLLISQHPL